MAAFPTSVATDSDLYIAVNAVSTQLTDNPLTIGATTVNVTSTALFPTVGFISIDNEIIKYTGKTGTSFTGCTRAADGTSATSHVQNSQVFHNVIAVHHNALKDDLIATEQFISDIIGRVSTQIKGPDGTVSLPGHSFSADTDTGMWRPGANNLRFAVGGNSAVDITTTNVTSFLAHLFADGTLSLPSLSFSADTDTGIYRAAANQMRLVTGGAIALDITTTNIFAKYPVNHSDGTAGLPSITFENDSDTGFYGDAANSIRVTTGGTQRFKISSQGIQMIDTAITIENNAGSVTVPSYSFAGDNDTGIYHSAANRIDFAAGGNNPVFITAGGLNITTGFDVLMGGTCTIQNSNGSLSLPSYTFSGDPDTGIYHVGANDLGLVAGGVLAAEVTSTKFISTVLFLAPNGTASVPSYTFGGDQDTGLFTGSSNTLSITIGGLETFRIEPSNSANDIRMFVYDHTAATLKQVSRGASDSGGTGFRLLRVTN